jgi:hypothetical protein
LFQIINIKISEFYPNNINPFQELLSIDIVGIEFTDFDIDYLKQELNAKTKSVKYKRHGGDLDTLSVWLSH